MARTQKPIEKCPLCPTTDIPPEARRYLDPYPAKNAWSRYYIELRICSDCGKAEGLISLASGTLNFNMARVAIYNEREESRRLPPGIPHGLGLIPTGVPGPGQDELEIGGEYCVKCGAFIESEPHYFTGAGDPLCSQACTASDVERSCCDDY